MASDTLIRNNNNNSNRVPSAGSTNSEQRSLTGSLIEKFEKGTEIRTSTPSSISSSSNNNTTAMSTSISNMKGKIISPRKKAIARSKEENSKSQSKNPFKNILKKSSSSSSSSKNGPLSTTTNSSTFKPAQPRSTSSSSLKNLLNGNNTRSAKPKPLTSQTNSKTIDSKLTKIQEQTKPQGSRVSSLSQEPSEAEKSHRQILFQSEKAKILEYGGSSDKISSTPGSLLGIGSLEVYKIQKEESVAYIHCGSVIYPLLSKSKIIRVGFNAFILPLSNPERYWKITLDTKDIDVITGLSNQFQKNSDFYSVYVDSQEEEEEVKEKQTYTPQVPAVVEKEEELIPYQQLLKEAELRKKKSQGDKLSVVMMPRSEEDLDPFTSELSFNFRKAQQIKKTSLTNLKKSSSDTSITSTVACFSLNDYEDEDEKLVHDNDETKVNSTEEETNNNLQINHLNDDIPDLHHPIPIRPSSVGSSLDSVLDKFDISAPNSPELSQSNVTNEGTLSTIANVGGVYHSLNTTTIENSPQITADSLFLNEEDSWMDPDDEVDLRSTTQDDSRDRVSISSVGLNSSLVDRTRVSHSNNSSINNLSSLHIPRKRITSQDSKSSGFSSRNTKNRISSFDISRRYSLTFKEASYTNLNGTTLLNHPQKDLKEILRGNSNKSTLTNSTTTGDSSIGDAMTRSSNSLLDARPSLGSTDISSSSGEINHTKYGSYSFRNNMAIGSNSDLEFNLRCFEESEEPEANPKTTTTEAVIGSQEKSAFNITNILGW